MQKNMLLDSRLGSPLPLRDIAIKVNSTSSQDNSNID